MVLFTNKQTNKPKKYWKKPNERDNKSIVQLRKGNNNTNDHFTQEVALMPGCWKGLLMMPMRGTEGTTHEPAAGTPCRMPVFKSLGATAAMGTECANGACKWTPFIMCMFTFESSLPTAIWLGAPTMGLTNEVPVLFTAAPGCMKDCCCILSCTSCMEKGTAMKVAGRAALGGSPYICCNIASWCCTATTSGWCPFVWCLLAASLDCNAEWVTAAVAAATACAWKDSNQHSGSGKLMDIHFRVRTQRWHILRPLVKPTVPECISKL